MNLNTSRKTLATWLSKRLYQWRVLEVQLKQGSSSANNAREARDVLSGFRALLADLALARKNMPGGQITYYLEGLFIRAHEQIYRPPGHFLLRYRDLYNWEIPRLMRQMSGVLSATAALFVCSILVGGLLVASYPDLATLFASEEMIDTVQQGRLWTEGLLNIAPSSMISLGIIANNITVSLFAFALGALYGLGTLYIIVLNGLMLGGIFAYTHQYQLAQKLFEFVFAHGVVELSVIVIAGAMGLQLGEALVRPGDRNRLQAFQETSMNAGKVLLAAVPFLIVAGLIEGFISPDPRYGMSSRLIVGIGSGMMFWLIMLFGLPRHRNRIDQ